MGSGMRSNSLGTVGGGGGFRKNSDIEWRPYRSQVSSCLAWTCPCGNRAEQLESVNISTSIATTMLCLPWQVVLSF